MIKFKIQSIIFLLFLLSVSSLGQENYFTITVKDTTYKTITNKFHGIQYHSNTFSNQDALEKLEPLNMYYVRIWAEIKNFHPEPGEWNWGFLDEQINEIITAGYIPVLCLWGEKWFIGSPDSAWWNFESALVEWDTAAFKLADRYKGQIDRIIVFDELNMLYPNNDYYITFQKSAQLYLRAAQKVKLAAPNILCGGPSSFGGWENGHWANYVIQEPNGENFLDFISSNTFLSWNPNDSDELIMDRTIWYEEAAQKIYSMIGTALSPELMLDAYNLSAVWTWNGKLYTDPRNINVFGGVYQTAALLHSAKGGFDITLHWETIGGFGILDWFTNFKKLPPYYSWKMMIAAAGLSDSATIIGCSTNEPPKENAPHHGGMKVNLYRLQPFAIKRKNDAISVILINKYANDTLTARIQTPAGMMSFSVYRFEQNRVENCIEPILEQNTSLEIELDCPPFSVTVVKYEPEPLSISTENHSSPSSKYQLFQNYPNPFNPNTFIKFSIPKNGYVELKVYNIIGKEIRALIKGHKFAGSYIVQFDGSGLTSGIYFYKLEFETFIQVKKFILLK